MKTTNYRNAILGAMTALSIALPQLANAQEIVASHTTIITACGKLFSIDSNAAGLTPEQRASIVQKNLDGALIAAKHKTPEAVRVGMMNHNPIVTLDGFYIVTADANSAERNHMSQLALARKWADSIRFCMADAAAMNNYIAMLTGRYPRTRERISAENSTDVAVLPWGMNLPVRLDTPIVTEAMALGDPITAELTTDVPLAPHFNSYLPAGTKALGSLVKAEPFNCNHIAGKKALMLSFYALQTPDGKEIPINGHILGGPNTWRYISVQPIQPNCRIEAPVKVTSNTISMNNNGSATVTTTTTASGCTAPLAERGTIIGAWRGECEDLQIQDNFPRLMLSRNVDAILPAGSPLFLQLNASSSVAISSAFPVEGAQVSSVGIGM